MFTPDTHVASVESDEVASLGCSLHVFGKLAESGNACEESLTYIRASFWASTNNAPNFLRSRSVKECVSVFRLAR